jgi:thiol-disulfide isomerase/thioredoxin
MIKKLVLRSIILTFVVAVLLLTSTVAKAQENSVNIYFFWGEGCPHCVTQKPFLLELKEKYPEIEIHEFEVWGSSKNRQYLVAVGNRLRTDISGVPFTVIGDETFTGFSKSITAPQIEDRVRYCLENSCTDSVSEIVGLTTRKEQAHPEQKIEESAKIADITNNNVIPEKIDLPLIGEIQTKNYSLPVFAVVLGALDGFNPCAMWALLFLISLLLGMKDKKRRWILGTAFIITSAFVYFLFMAAWLNLILFIGFIVWVRILIGIIALGGGAYNLKEFFTNKDNTCKVTGGEKRKAVFENLKAITH